jgi:uncharacterized protein DUF6056
MTAAPGCPAEPACAPPGHVKTYAVTDGQAPVADRAAGGLPRAAGWWALLVVPLWLVLVLCAHWEPVFHDGWSHVGWFRDLAHGLGSFYDFVRECYTRENPRLGQPLTLLSYAPGPYHAILTPLLELAVLGLLTAVALGRWPSLARSDDALAAALVTAVLFACQPQIGPMLTYRPFTWNYLFGLGMNLWWLMPYRRERIAPLPVRWWRAPASLGLGFAAGLCNEHTGIAFGAMAGLATWIAWRRGGLRPWMIAGLVGLAAGYVVLLTAPAQHLRYGGLAEHAGLVARIVDRGAAENLRVFGHIALGLAPALPLVMIGLAQRPPPAPATAADRGSHAVLALAGVLCAVTLLGSPRIGGRLYLATIALIGAGLTGWLVGRLTAAWARRGCAILAAAVLLWVGVRLVAIYRVVGPLGAIRSERLVHAPRGAAVTVPPYPYPQSRYFPGDDFENRDIREFTARVFGLSSLALEPAVR